jgi:glutamate N-acetyltransferase/amino-acid N-acetyltransferase
MSVTAPEGFAAAGLHCGIKPSGNPDLALVVTENHRAVPAAAVFTQNLAAAGPVQVSKRHLRATAGYSAAVILNSGNANCATGNDVEIAEEMCTLTALELRCRIEEVLVCSTGLIGVPLDIEPLRRGIPNITAALDTSWGRGAARAIMTTDTVPKEVAVAGDGWTIGGMAKGAAMLAPNMATMLAVLTTDASIYPGELHALLDRAVSMTFNRIVVDGCTSTNDTVIVLANGLGGPADLDQFGNALAEACASLAMQMVRDAEGHTKVVTISVEQAATPHEAEIAARKLASSLLVKASFYGSDPYWGRVLSELGSCGVTLDIDEVTIAYDDILVSKGQAPTGADASEVVKNTEFTLTCRLGVGRHDYFLHTNDLSHAYIDENMETS